jgi:hypothetical protein
MLCSGTAEVRDGRENPIHCPAMAQSVTAPPEIRAPRTGSWMALELTCETSDEFLEALTTVLMKSLRLSWHEHERRRGRGVGCRHVCTLLHAAGPCSVVSQMERIERCWTSSSGRGQQLTGTDRESTSQKELVCMAPRGQAMHRG